MSLVIVSDSLLRKTKVGDSDVALSIEENVLWLQISIDNVVRMQASNRVYHLRGVDLGPLLAELALLAQVGEQLPSVQEVDEEVELGLRLEGVVQPHDVGVLDLLEDVSLGYKNSKIKLREFRTYLGS